MKLMPVKMLLDSFLSHSRKPGSKVIFHSGIVAIFLDEVGKRIKNLDEIFSWQCEQVDARSYLSKLLKICQSFNVYKAGRAICDL